MPCYYDLSDAPTAFWDVVKSDGGDIRITEDDSVTEVPVEIVFIDTGTDTGEVWFKGDFTGLDDNVFVIHAGNAGASKPAETDTYGSQAVWNSAYTAVYHCQEDPSGSSPQILDSTSNEWDGTSAGTMTSGDSVAGKLSGNALDFDGSDDTIDCGGSGTTNFKLPTYTVEMWVQSPNAPDTAAIEQCFAKDSNYLFSWRHTSGAYQQAHAHNASGWKIAKIASTLSADTWYHVVCTFDGSDIRVYLDGSDDGNSATTANPETATGNFYFGSGASGASNFEGKLDEVRVASGDLGADYIAIQYDNQHNTSSGFYTISADVAAFVPQVIIM
jgi:hypothetical protein